MLRRRKLNENLCQGDKSVSVAKHISAEKIKKNPTCLNLESKKLLVEGSSLLITSQIISLSQITDQWEYMEGSNWSKMQGVKSGPTFACISWVIYIYGREREKKSVIM